MLLAAAGGPPVPAAPVRRPGARTHAPTHGRLHPAAAPAPPPPRQSRPRRRRQLQVRGLDRLDGGGLPAGPQHERARPIHAAAARRRGRHQHQVGSDVAAVGQHVAAGEDGRRLRLRLAELVVAGLQHQLHLQQRQGRFQQQQLQERRPERQPAADLPLDEEGASRTKYSQRQRRDEETTHLVHPLSNPRVRERIPLQPVPDATEKDRNRARLMPHRKTNQNLVPEPADEVEKRTQDGQFPPGVPPGRRLRIPPSHGDGRHGPHAARSLRVRQPLQLALGLLQRRLRPLVGPSDQRAVSGPRRRDGSPRGGRPSVGVPRFPRR